MSQADILGGHVGSLVDFLSFFWLESFDIDFDDDVFDGLSKHCANFAITINVFM